MPETFNYVKKGYDPQEVDQYIDKLEEVLKSYKDKDTAIKNAIVNAQIAADNIVRNAELRAEDMIAVANKQLKDIWNSIEKQRVLLSQFEEDYTHMIKKYLTDFESSKIRQLYKELDELQNYLDALSGTEKNKPEEDAGTQQNTSQT